MKGLELSRRFYEELGKELIIKAAPEYENRIAVGMAGRGSECFGFDDEISQDHDFSAGFSLWLTTEDEAKAGFALMRAYSKLPKVYENVTIQGHSLFGESHFGVHTIASFFQRTLGMDGIPQHWKQWFQLPDHALAEAVNGAVFRDDLGAFSAIRTGLVEQMPADVKLKKLAAHLALAAQSGQYNFPRCMKHGEYGAAQLSLFEFVNEIFYLTFSLQSGYAPYYKWRFRGLRAMPHGLPLARKLEFLISTGNVAENAQEKINIIEEISATVIEQLRRQNKCYSSSDYLEDHGVALMRQIGTRDIASLHIMDYGQ